MINVLRQKLPEITENEPMAAHTTFKIGGPARYFYVAQSRGQLLAAVKAAEELNIPYFIFGRGSNLLVSDEGYQGLVIKNLSDGIEVSGDEITAESGVGLSRLVGAATQAGLTGLEFAAGIPGSAGGAALGNAGAYGSSLGGVIKEIEIYQNGEVKILSQKQMQYGYRDSVLKHQPGIVLSVKIKLKKAALKEIQKEVVRIIMERKEKLPWEPSAGCIFKNIELKQAEIDEKRIIKELDITKDEWKNATKYGKLAAGFIIDHLNLKGKVIGGCQISQKHSAFFVNLGQAKAAHVMMLISDVKMEVRNRLGIQLQEEVRYLGF